MTVGELRRALRTAGEHDIVLGWARDESFVSAVTAVMVEVQGTDENGNVTSTGGTVWLKLEEE